MTTLLADLESYAASRGETFDPTDLQAIIALEAASDVIRGYCNRTFDFIADDEIVLDGTGSRSLLLPELPVIDLTEVTTIAAGQDPVVVDIATLYTDPAGIIWALDTFSTCQWMAGHGNVGVTYSHGYLLPGQTSTHDPAPPPLPADIQMVCMQLAGRLHARSLSKGQLVTTSSQSIGTYSESVTYDTGTSTGTVSDLTSVETDVLGQYRLARVA